MDATEEQTKRVKTIFEDKKEYFKVVVVVAAAAAYFEQGNESLDRW